MTDRPLRDQRIVRTGGSSGIGLATAKAAVVTGSVPKVDGGFKPT